MRYLYVNGMRYDVTDLHLVQIGAAAGSMAIAAQIFQSHL